MRGQRALSGWLGTPGTSGPPLQRIVDRCVDLRIAAHGVPFVLLSCPSPSPGIRRFIEKIISGDDLYKTFSLTSPNMGIFHSAVVGKGLLFADG